MADVVKLNYPAAMVIDWKAGKSANVDPIQNVLLSLMLLIQFPKLDRVVSIFAWLKEDSRTVQRLDRRDAADQWALLMPRVERFRQASELVNFPPQRGRLCRNYCPVKTCEYHGR